MKILIIGAGPTGLVAALELKRRGVDFKIIDKKSEPSKLSRAVGINARSLEILEESGVTPMLLAQGIKVDHVNIYNQKIKNFGRICISMIRHKYNFMLSLPQDETENILRKRLETYGVKVGYGIEFLDIQPQEKNAKVFLLENGQKIDDEYDLIIAADGAGSLVRQKMNIKFNGFDYQDLWSIADFSCKNFPYKKENGAAFIQPNGSIGFVIRIGDDRYRAVTNGVKPFANILGEYKIDEIYRENNFHISFRQAETYKKHCVYLAGDAAHVHSPIGGRGMNLGMEDGYFFAKYFVENRLEDYVRERHLIGKKFVALNVKVTGILTTKNKIVMLLRNSLIRVVTQFPSLQVKFVSKMMGVM